MIQHTYVGCDLAKAHVDFHDAASGRHERIANTSDALAAHLARYVEQHTRVVFAART